MPAVTTYLLAAGLGYGIYASEKARKEAKEAAKEPLPPPEPPLGVPETGTGEVTRQKHMIRGGRGGTILAGQLTPERVGKKRILGGAA